MSIRANNPAQRLDQRITFQRKVQTQDSGNGELDVTWTDVAKCWACVDAQKSNEVYQSQQIEAENMFTVIIRYRDDIDPNMRIDWKGLKLDIRNIPDQQRRGRWMFLLCQSGLNDG